MKFILTLLLCLVLFNLQAQLSVSEIEEKRTEHLKELLDTSAHVLNHDEITHFQGLDYFEVDTTYQIEAQFIKKKGKVFQMPSSTDKYKLMYRRIGYVQFDMHGKTNRLEVYQNMRLKKEKEYKDYLFLPFRDGTSRKESYGGGRFLDLKKPKGKTIHIDFNLAYNPYCAYSHRYTCPIPPPENELTIEIKAGEKTPIGH